MDIVYKMYVYNIYRLFVVLYIIYIQWSFLLYIICICLSIYTLRAFLLLRVVEGVTKSVFSHPADPRCHLRPDAAQSIQVYCCGWMQTLMSDFVKRREIRV